MIKLQSESHRRFLSKFLFATVHNPLIRWTRFYKYTSLLRPIYNEREYSFNGDWRLISLSSKCKPAWKHRRHRQTETSTDEANVSDS